MFLRVQIFLRLSIRDWIKTGVFEIDRSNLVLQLRSVRQAIIEGAEEMEMVAIERVHLLSQVSQALTRTSRKLYVVGEELNGLLYLIERAQVPKADGRPAPKRKPPRRCVATAKAAVSWSVPTLTQPALPATSYTP